MDEAALREWSAWLKAARRPTIDRAIRDLYARLDKAVTARGPTCWISGRCCNFDAYGHRMYVTALEAAWVVQTVQQGGDETHSVDGKAHSSARTVVDPASIRLDAPCVYQVNSLCGIHAIRPLGCRIFFCQVGTQAWQQDVYESFLADLRALHDEHGINYAYIEWRSALRGALTAAASNGASP